MQNSSQKSTPRPLIYHPTRTKAEIHQFVMGNASQAYSVNLPFEPARTAPNFLYTSSLFDRYNRNNLHIRDCDPKDIITLHKNIVMAEQPLSKEVIQQVSEKVATNRMKEMAATGELFHREPAYDQFLRTAPVPAAPSREYQQNEIIFNYKEMGEAKRERKKQFLSEIQARIAEAEREIADLEELQEQERVEMGALTRQQQRVGEQLSRNVQVGRVKQKVGQATGWEEPQPCHQPLSIHPEMEPREINELLEGHIRANEDLLELAGSVRRKSEKSKEKIMTATSGFGNTMQKKEKPQKSLMSTMKAGFKPPSRKAK